MVKNTVKKVQEKSLPLTKFLPHMMTLSALCLGLSAVRFAINEQWVHAVSCILAAGLLDGLDGKIARLFNAASDLGAQLDSLADAVNFGVVPSIVVFLWVGQEFPIKGIGWAVSMFFAICMVLRLARFNATLEENKDNELAKAFFTGVPAPLGAALALFPLVLEFEFGAGFYSKATFVVPYLSVIAFLTASTIPTISSKKFNIKEESTSLFLIIFALVLIVLVIKPWLMMTLMIVAYILYFPFGIMLYMKMKNRINAN